MPQGRPSLGFWPLPRYLPILQLQRLKNRAVPARDLQQLSIFVDLWKMRIGYLRCRLYFENRRKRMWGRLWQLLLSKRWQDSVSSRLLQSVPVLNSRWQMWSSYMPSLISDLSRWKDLQMQWVLLHELCRDLVSPGRMQWIPVLRVRRKVQTRKLWIRLQTSERRPILRSRMW